VTEPVISTASEIPPAREEEAINAYAAEQQARQRRSVECAAPDVVTLKTKLAELGITPIDERLHDRPYRVADNGTVTALIAQPNADDFERRRVWACARAGRLWLRATDYVDGVIGDVVGELHTLADVGRALVEGPQSPPTPASNRDLAERQLRVGWGECSMDTHAVCSMLAGLTHAVLAVADAIGDNGGTLADIAGNTEHLQRRTGGHW
jgi:hypothetical protein